MAIDPQEALAAIGYDAEKFEDLEAFKTQITTDFVKLEDAHREKAVIDKVFGTINGTLRHKLKKAGEALGVEGKFDELDPADGIKVLQDGLNERITTLTAAIEEAKKGKGKPSEELEALQRKFDTTATQVNDLKKALADKEGEFTAYKGQVEAEALKGRISARRAKAIGSLELREMNELESIGFREAVAKSVALKEEDGAIYVLNEKGERAKAPDAPFDLLTPEAAVEAVARGLGLMKDQVKEKEKRTIPISGTGAAQNTPPQHQQQDAPRRRTPVRG